MGVGSKVGSIDNILKSLGHTGEGPSRKGKEVVQTHKGNEDSAAAIHGYRPQRHIASKQISSRATTREQPDHWKRLIKQKSRTSSHASTSLASTSRTWADLFPSQTRRSPTTTLEPVELSTHEGRIFVDCDKEDLKDMDSHWAHSLVGYVIGKRPFYKPFVEFLHRIWKPKGNIEVLLRAGGFFIAKFSEEDDLLNAMEGGPWLMAGRPIVLRRWNRGMRLEIERLETIPLWIRFPALPLHMWGTRLISKLASAVGKPLYMDTATASRSRVDFARVCVEISAQSELPSSILYREESIWKEIPVDYEWKPSPCPQCRTFGHSESQCSLQGVSLKSNSGTSVTPQYVPVTKSQRYVPTDGLATKGPIIALSEIPEQSLSGQNPIVGPIKAIKGKEQNNSPKGNDTNRFSVLALVTEDQVLEELSEIIQVDEDSPSKKSILVVSKAESSSGIVSTEATPQEDSISEASLQSKVLVNMELGVISQEEPLAPSKEGVETLNQQKSIATSQLQNVDHQETVHHIPPTPLKGIAFDTYQSGGTLTNNLPSGVSQVPGAHNIPRKDKAHLDLVYLLETKLQPHNQDQVCRLICPGYNYSSASEENIFNANVNLSDDFVLLRRRLNIRHPLEYRRIYGEAVG
ncbi:hypothetical protein QJS10_CPA10g01534 [Acorus calamus]|uniref:DUF4283 domain-containing protein n=1 Tax=Acorus calamus TaxID=4465 RepID=A0AAV9E1H4_ACOCL|nr:hypothetical protein QJS10_CPA10g01534 [Acorus calamus]